ncbi:MAG: PTS sugar transporter subunit IIB [Anaerolineaceae bacterium]
MAYRIVVACGAGINTSTLGEEMIRERLSNEGRGDIEVVHVLMSNIEAYEDKMDILVSMQQVYREFKCPVVLGLPFLIGTKSEKEDILNKIMELVKNLDNK